MKFEELLVCLPDARGIKLAGNPEITGVTEDSRQVAKGFLFVARGGSKTSGAKYVNQALAAGAVAVVAGEPLEVPGHAAFAHVPNANLALGILAHKFHGNPSTGMKVLAVTGTNGKTTITYLVRSILHAAGHKCGLIGTVQVDDGKTVIESDMTTPGPVELAALFARMKANGVQYAVMEASSHALHQQRLAGLTFAVGMFTNLTGDHLDYHGTMEEYAAAKAGLFSALPPGSAAVVNADDQWVANMVEQTAGNVVRYGLAGGCEWSASIISMSSAGMILHVKSPAGEFKLNSPLVGKHNVYNTLCAAAAADAVGIQRDAIVAGLEKMACVPGRLQPVVPAGETRGALPFQVFVDYAHTHDALENVLSALRPLTRGKLICVFGCGGDRDPTKRPKMGTVVEKWADKIFVTSDNPRTEDPAAIIGMILAGFGQGSPSKLTVQPDRRAAIRQAIQMAQAGDVVLIAGKGHENYQIIGTQKHHFDDVEEAARAMGELEKRDASASLNQSRGRCGATV